MLQLICVLMMIGSMFLSKIMIFTQEYRDYYQYQDTTNKSYDEDPIKESREITSISLDGNSNAFDGTESLPLTHKLVQLRDTVWKKSEPVFQRDSAGILQPYYQFIFFHPKQDAIAYQYSLVNNLSLPDYPCDKEYIVLQPLHHSAFCKTVGIDMDDGGVFSYKIDSDTDALYGVIFLYLDKGMDLYESNIKQSFDIKKESSYNKKMQNFYQQVLSNKINMKKFYQVLFYNK